MMGSGFIGFIVGDQEPGFFLSFSPVHDQPNRAKRVRLSNPAPTKDLSLTLVYRYISQTEPAFVSQTHIRIPRVTNDKVPLVVRQPVQQVTGAKTTISNQVNVAVSGNQLIDIVQQERSVC